MLVHAVVIAGDGARAHVHVASDVAVAQIREVVRLGTGADDARLDLDEIAQVHVLAELRARPDARIRPDAAALAHLGVLEMAEGLDARACRNADVLEHAVRAHHHPVAQHHVALEYAVHVDVAVAAAGERPAHIDARRIGKAHPRLEQRLSDVPLVDAFQLRELRAAIDSERFPDQRGLRGSDGDPPGHSHGHHIGEVVLPLRVVAGELAEPGFEGARRQHHDARVDLAYGAFLRGRVLLLHDALQRAVRPPHDTPVAGRIVERYGEHRHSLRRRFHQGAQRLSARKRHVAIQNQGGRVFVEVRQRLHQGVACAELRVLLHPRNARVRVRRANRLAAMAIHHADAPRCERARRVQHMRKQRSASQRMQHFGLVRMHAFALACGKNDNVHEELETAAITR